MRTTLPCVPTAGCTEMRPSGRSLHQRMPEQSEAETVLSCTREYGNKAQRPYRALVAESHVSTDHLLLTGSPLKKLNGSPPNNVRTLTRESCKRGICTLLNHSRGHYQGTRPAGDCGVKIPPPVTA